MGQKMQWITPGPQQADSLRPILQQGSLQCDFDVLSIAQFIKNECEGPVIRKSELITSLGVLWKKFFPGKHYARFSRGLKLLTDLRSYSLNIDLIKTVLEDFDQDLQKAVRLFWQLCDELELYDEQRVYHELAEKWRLQDGQHCARRHFIFWGFEFFSNLQIGLLEALALRHQVDILAPAMAFDYANNLDWPSWLEGHLHPPLTEQKSNSRPVKIIRYPKNHLNWAISSFLKKVPLQNYDIVFGKKAVEFEDILELPVKGHFFKSPVGILKNPLLKAHLEIQQLINQKTSTVIDHCCLQLQQSLDQQNFREIKNWSLIKNFLQEWQGKSDENMIFQRFDWELMQQVLLLDHPRPFYLPVSERDFSGKILGLKDLSDRPTIPKLIIVQSKYQGLRSRDSEYSLQEIGQLAAIGPVKRAEFEFLFVQQTFKELLANEQAYLFWEEGLETKDWTWNELMKMFAHGRELQEIPLKYESKNKIQLSLKKTSSHIVGKLSPTKLQTYIDCPQKYYYQYVEKINTNPHLQHEFLPNEKGLVEHSVVRKYLQQSLVFDEKLFSQVCNDEMAGFCQEKNKNLSQVNRLLITEEVKINTRNGIQLLLAFLSNVEEFCIDFEVAINNQDDFGGSVDCVIQSPSGDYLFDFKRSSASIPIKKDIEEYRKIQIWYYAFHLSHSYSWKGLGHINLNDPDGSSFWSESISLPRGKNYKISELNMLIQQYRKIESNHIQRLAMEKDFLPLPLSAKSCRFCPLNVICPKRPELSGEGPSLRQGLS